MCLILFAWRCHPGYRLILATNRDEFFARPTAAMGTWPDWPEIVAGRDLQAGGTWFGLARDGRFAAVTNYRDPNAFSADALSRGRLPVNYLQSGVTPWQFCTRHQQEWPQYNGFNLLLGDAGNLVYASNRLEQPHQVAPGIHGLSNHLLDSPWPKIARGTELFRQLLDNRAEIDCDRLFALLEDRWQPPAAELPDTGVGPEWEKLLAPIFISGSNYGTRSSLVLTIEDSGRTTCFERRFSHVQGAAVEDGRIGYCCSPPNGELKILGT
jgi:uncharacterized protein with NRDE domain